MFTFFVFLFVFLFSFRASLNFKVASQLILKWKITFIGKILALEVLVEFWGRLVPFVVSAKEELYS